MLDGVDANENMGIQAKERRVRVAFSVCVALYTEPRLSNHACTPTDVGA